MRQELGAWKTRGNLITKILCPIVFEIMDESFCDQQQRRVGLPANLIHPRIVEYAFADTRVSVCLFKEFLS